MPDNDKKALEDLSEMINAADARGWSGANGLRITRATIEEVTAELEIRPIHLQAYGIVHGGVHAAIIETVASVGAAVNVMPHGRSAVGLENHTSFLRAVRSGVLRAVAKPLTRGRRTHVWEATVFDDKGRVAATGRVRLMVLEPEAELAGEKAGLA
ncbi:MAG: PaaI family thioesterase [Myxococcaceae bacterium]